MSLSLSLQQFLRAVVSEEGVLKPIPNGGYFSRLDLIKLINDNVTTEHSPGEIMDAASYNGFLDARNKRGPVFEDFYVTNAGRDFVNDPSKFENLEDSTEKARLIDSTDWTGLSKAISYEQKVVIRAKANELLSLIIQSDADEQTRLDACKRVEAVICLLEAPNSPWRDIVTILTHPVLQTFFASTSLIQFIVGIAS
ncbi:hypothetical protein SOQ14_12130 [Erythrobacter sp. T5W1-R]|uniref:hypothetical protein n=1 Tax=Erythrobacter sp. T5W1-R TaxID=3101752 RepID=UPI002AFDE424|nr:hypothetical protein [Erythrobacter sp. T5W1-R]MEA1619666.1 hypothetical protein [Erythrobacter sp. T5W1-R]